MLENKETIPIVYCIDNNYAIPAAVCTASLLEHASKEYNYKIYIINSGVKNRNKRKIEKTAEKYKDNAEIFFLDNVYDFSNMWNTVGNKSHFSKEIIYKLMLDTIFTQYEKIILTDVDVVFLGDISKSYTEFDVNDDYYLAGIKSTASKNDDYKGYAHYANVLPKEDIEKLMDGCGAGYLVYNLKNIRRDDMQKKFLECFEDKKSLLTQPEQDVLGICCYGKIKFLPLEYMLCTYTYDEIAKDKSHAYNMWNFSKEDVEHAINNTVQLHYACAHKPWKIIKPNKSEIWYEYFSKTEYSRLSLIKYFFKDLKYAAYVLYKKIIRGEKA